MELRGLLVVEEHADACGESGVVPATESVANRPIAHHVLDALEAAGVCEVTVVVSERSVERVRDCLEHRRMPAVAPLQFVSHHGPIQLASALGLAAPIIKDAPCIVHAAGGLLAEPLTSLANGLDNGSDAVLTVHQSSSPEQRLSTRAQSLLRLAELDPSRAALGVAGVWAFGPGALQRAAGPISPVLQVRGVSLVIGSTSRWWPSGSRRRADGSTCASSISGAHTTGKPPTWSSSTGSRWTESIQTCRRPRPRQEGGGPGPRSRERVGDRQRPGRPGGNRPGDSDPRRLHRSVHGNWGRRPDRRR